MSKPKISLNKLAEYLEANPSRRKTIVYDAKYPEAFKTTRYKEARDVIMEYLITNDENEVLLAIDKLKKKKTSTEFQEQDRKLSIKVLSDVLNMDLSFLKNTELSLFADKSHKLEICGVTVSISPDLFVTSLKDKNLIGVIKLHISKNNKLSEEGQNIATLLLKHYTQEALADTGEIVSNKLCVSIDLFNNSTQYCPSATAQRFKRIESACEEIALRWDSL